MDEFDSDLIYGLALGAIGVLIYLSPVYLAFRWRHRQRYLLSAVVLLLGWSGLAWLVGLVWAIAGRPGAAKDQREDNHDPDSHLALPRDVHDTVEDAFDDDC